MELALSKVVLIRIMPAAESQPEERNFMMISFIDGRKTEVYRIFLGFDDQGSL
jgi:hypothetical protein